MDNNENIKVEATEPKKKQTLSIISLICGIATMLGVLTAFIPLLGMLTSGLILPAGIVGIVLGAIGIKKEEGNKLAKIGLILSIVGLVLNIVVTILSVVLGALLGGALGLMEGAMMSNSYYY